MAKYIINSMLQAHFRIHTFLSVQGDELFVLFAIDDERLLTFADETRFQLEFDGDYCKNVLGECLDRQ